LRPGLFVEDLAKDLKSDAAALLQLLIQAGEWDPAKDEKLNTPVSLLATRHPDEKIIVFTQFADTVAYLERQLIPRSTDNDP